MTAALQGLLSRQPKMFWREAVPLLACTSGRTNLSVSRSGAWKRTGVSYCG